MIKKNRIPILKDIAARILFLSDRTCCKCNIPGRPIQIHHIDEDPSNNDELNLAVLCSICHEETMLKGGFGRKLDSMQVTLYRDSWLNRVQARKEKADELASIATVIKVEDFKEEHDSLQDNLIYKLNYNRNTLQDYINKIARIHSAQWIIAQSKFDSGITSEIIQGSYDLIDFYEEVLVEITTFYPKGHFNLIHPKLFINKLVADKFLWNRLILEPGGVGEGGTMISVIAAGNVVNELNDLIVQLVKTLTWTYHGISGINIENWEAKWRKTLK